MANCKDCLHVEVCKNIYEVHGDGLSEESYVCDHFSNRSRFVELPCKIGDIVYCPYQLQYSEHWEIDEWIVTEISFVNYHVGYLFDKDGNWDDRENQIKIQLVLSDNSKFKGGPVDSICISPDDLGNGFFISYEKAEQAIKGREKNGKM